MKLETEKYINRLVDRILVLVAISFLAGFFLGQYL